MAYLKAFYSHVVIGVWWAFGCKCSIFNLLWFLGKKVSKKYKELFYLKKYSGSLSVLH